jgi:hypothetical protein
MFDIFYLSQPTNLFPHEQKAASIKDACVHSKTRYLWVVDSANDYSNFVRLWEPSPWESEQTHVRRSQHQSSGGTMLVPKSGSTDVNRSHVAVPRIKSVPIVAIDHGNGINFSSDYQTRFVSSYLGTLKRVLQKVDSDYVWVASSVCDYAAWDWTWHPSEWQQELLHVFASNEQKFGDTFFVHVPSFMKKAQELEVLEWYDGLNFVPDLLVPRSLPPAIQYHSDSVVPAVWDHDFTQPIVQFYHDTESTAPPTVGLWQERTRTVVPLSDGAGTVLIPRDCKNYIKTQIYDYPWIDKHKKTMLDPLPDVIFLSNGEPLAEKNWQNLLSVCPRAKRSDGITGREAAYKAAARLSQTDWFYAVFAKTWVLPEFKFDFKPDRLQAPKHYIFHSRNALNGLEYGAMNINLYNRQLVLDTVPGIDFTLSSPHEVVPVCASISIFNEDPWLTWRSSFREVLKLKQEVDRGAGVEIQYRLKVWCSLATGENAEFCLAGANDAMAFYAQVSGDPVELQKSFDWAWLQDFYYSLYNTTPWSKA